MSFYKNISNIKEYSYVELSKGVFIPIGTTGIAYFNSKKYPFRCEKSDGSCLGCIFNDCTGHEIGCTQLCMKINRMDNFYTVFKSIEL